MAKNPRDWTDLSALLLVDPAAEALEPTPTHLAVQSNLHCIVKTKVGHVPHHWDDENTKYTHTHTQTHAHECSAVVLRTARGQTSSKDVDAAWGFWSFGHLHLGTGPQVRGQRSWRRTAKQELRRKVPICQMRGLLGRRVSSLGVGERGECWRGAVEGLAKMCG